MLVKWQLCLGVLAVFGIQLVEVDSTKSATNKVVCYFGSWAGYRTGNGKFDPENIDPTLCTHLIYSFIGVNESGYVGSLDEWNDLSSGKDFINRFLNLSKKSPETKFLVSLGGWNEGSTKYSTIVNNDTLRSTLVTSIVEFLCTYGFQGLDLDWEYPAYRGGLSSDKVGYVKLLQELRTPFDEKNFTLTAAMGAADKYIGTAYNVSAIVQYLDFINMMTYDYHTYSDGVTGQCSPLYASSVDTTAYNKTLNANHSIHKWIEYGAPPEKLVLGAGAYGRTFTLASEGVVGPGANCTGAGTAGPYTQEAGTIGYNEIIEQQAAGNWTEVWDDEQKVPYTVKGDQWIGYDNVKSMKVKAQYAKDMCLGGMMMWSVETDDFLGLFHDEKNPLLRAINEVLGRNVSSSNSTSNSSSSSSS